LKYVLGILNSTLMDWYYRVSYSNVSSLTVNVTYGYLQQLPICDPRIDGRDTIVNPMIQHVDQILQLNKQIGSIKQKIRSFPSSYIEGDWRFDKLSGIIKGKNLSRESYAISEKSLRTDYKQRDLIDSAETFKIILTTGEFMDFDSEEVASYVFETLKSVNRITRRELLELKIPKQPYLKNLMNQYRKDKEQIVKDEKAVEELEKQIDDLVYKLYDITYAERRAIEDYMKEFRKMGTS
jgi:hypothetical protein